jgi:hypothetical protein
MDISKFLGKALGLYLIIIAVAMLINTQHFITQIGQLINNSQLMFVTGFFTLLFGIFLVAAHNIWQWNWRLLITLLSWLILLKGASIVLYPQAVDQLTMQIMQNSTIMYASAGIDLVLGIILCYFGCDCKGMRCCHKNKH